MEETGRNCTSFSSMIGKVVEKKTDVFDSSQLFHQISYYYAVAVDDSINPQSLDKYEIDFEMTPTWLTIDEAISINNKYLKSESNIDWTKREIKILKTIRKIGIDKISLNI